MQGRTNKLVDGCYSFWQGAIFPIIHNVLSMYGDENLSQENWMFCQSLLIYHSNYASVHYIIYLFIYLFISEHMFNINFLSHIGPFFIRKFRRIHPGQLSKFQWRST